MGKRVNPLWLKTLGYRPFIVDVSIDFDDPVQAQSLSNGIREIVQRVSRKAVLISHAVSVNQALRTAELNMDLISDIVVLDALSQSHARGPRSHFIRSDHFLLQSLTHLPHVLRQIGIQLIAIAEEADRTTDRSTRASLN